MARCSSKSFGERTIFLALDLDLVIGFLLLDAALLFDGGLALDRGGLVFVLSAGTLALLGGGSFDFAILVIVVLSLATTRGVHVDVMRLQKTLVALGPVVVNECKCRVAD
jgi:hypothetical protein